MESGMPKEKSFFPLQVKSLAVSMTSPPQRGFYMTQVMLRLLAIVFTSAAISVMITSGQTLTMFGISFSARYSYSSAFRFTVGADVVVCCLSLLSLILLHFLSRPNSNPSNFFYLFLHDMVMTVLMISGCAAATAIGYVGRYGQSQTGWMAICDRLGKFCYRVTLSVVFSYLAFFCCFALTIMSAYKLKSRTQSEANK
ncbi:hypothetical protein F0562_004779 [Nyssa sinensis]|uniref:CASP-like protein n=1 Tax=Nyssa sinensis TaxID=561372 RepID=A0A5J5AHL5_9ASTE|nr:hypothetical protein F0562_004779 [Nyssa sinensis]